MLAIRYYCPRSHNHQPFDIKLQYNKHRDLTMVKINQDNWCDSNLSK